MNLLISIIFLLLLGAMAYPEDSPAVNYATFTQMTAAVLVYLVVQAAVYFYFNREKLFINPLFTSVLLVFGLNFGVLTNFIFLGDGKFTVADYFLGLDTDMYWYKIGMFNIGLALVAIINGHRSILGVWLHNRAEKFMSGLFAFLSGGDKKNLTFSFTKIRYIYLGVSLFRFWLLTNGLYGRLISDDTINSDGFRAVGQYINLVNGAGTFILFAVSYLYFAQKNAQRFFFAILGLELFWGFLAGARGTFLLPLAVVGIAAYLKTGRLHLSQIAVFGVGLFIAMTVVVPFKNFYAKYGSEIDLTNAVVIVSKFYDYYVMEENLLGQALAPDDGQEESQRSLGSDESLSWYQTLFHHTNYSTEIAASIRYKETYGIPDDAPNFLSNIVFSPLYAVIPRFLWPDKPLNSLGLWFKDSILNYQAGENRTAIGMTPIGYLYFTGGSIAVFIGFWLIGVLQRSFFLFLRDKSLFGVIVFVVMMSNFYYVDSGVDSIPIAYIRNLFVAVLCALLFCETKSKTVLENIK
jgi:hypothetical protein